MSGGRKHIVGVKIVGNSIICNLFNMARECGGTPSNKRPFRVECTNCFEFENYAGPRRGASRFMERVTPNSWVSYVVYARED